MKIFKYDGIFLNISLAKKYLEIFHVSLCKFSYAIGPFQTWMLHSDNFKFKCCNLIGGHPFMTSTKKSGFRPPSPVHMGRTPLHPLLTSTHGRHEIHTALLKRLIQ